MDKNTVKKRIFKSNAAMILAALFLLIIVNAFVIKIYTEYIEKEVKAIIERVADENQVEEMIKDFTIYRNEFIILFLIDGILCIAAFIIVNRLFTKNLTSHIMEPLDELAAGAERIKNNQLTQDIEYRGDAEFERVCAMFNDMQRSIVSERKKNRKYEKARTDMIAGLSHDLRTPLTAVRGTIKGLLDNVAETPEQRERFLQAAYRRTGEMETLLGRMIYLSKLESGNLSLNMESVKISDFIENYAVKKNELFDLSADQSGDLYSRRVGIYAHTEDCGGNVRVDRQQLERIFDNLVENSIKYSKKEPLKITISAAGTADGQYFRVCVRDNGEGVPEEKLPYIFDEFYRCDESRNKEEGSGLGLYIVKCLAEAMGGAVGAGNNGGFAVCIDLPSDKK